MRTVFVKDYGIHAGEKDRMNMLYLRKILEECRNTEEAAELIFEEGTYHFYPDYAFERTLCISNHDEDTIKRIAFDLTDCRHLTIRGKNSAFIFHTELLAFYFHNSEDVTLEGFSIDYERPAYSEGTIVSVDGPSMQLRIDKGRFPYYVAHQRIFFTGENFCHEIPFWMEVDPQKGEPSEGPYEMGFGTEPHADYGIWKELEEGLVEVTLEGTGRMKSFDGYTPGHVIVLRHHPRNYPATYVTDSKDITFRDVTIYHCAGMGITAQFTENILLERVAVTGKPESGHWFSLAADATHFVYCRGKIEIRDCLFERQLDDAVNIHGIYARVKKVLSKKELLVELVHHQQKGVPVGNAGDTFSFVRYETLLSMGESRAEQVIALNKDYTYLKFEKELPEGIKEKDSIENISYVPDVQIEGCTVRNNRARGFLLTSAGNVLVRNNVFHTSGTAILISGDAADWFESGATKHIVVENNRFDDCDHVKNWGQGVIQVDTPVREILPDQKLHQYLEVRNNVFISRDGELLQAKNVQTVVFAGNQITAPQNEETWVKLSNVGEYRIE